VKLNVKIFILRQHILGSHMKCKYLYKYGQLRTSCEKFAKRAFRANACS